MGATALPIGRGPAVAMAGPFGPGDTIDHFVPRDKKLKATWRKQLTDKGARTWYSGDDLTTIGMPTGGICAGQVYLTGDGRLAYWDIFNQHHNTGYGSTLPWWLLDRLHSTVANLATTTCQWWRNGRFWAWEGGGCCRGTCGHVWNFTAAEGWGSCRQRREGSQQDTSIEVRWGRLRLRQVQLETPRDQQIKSVTVNGRPTPRFQQKASNVVIDLEKEMVLGAGQKTDIRLRLT
jgi:hypothetical protein